MSRRIKISEEELVKLLAERQARGLEILYDHYSAALYGVIYRIVQQEEIAEDCLQETFLRIWKNFGQYSPAKGRLYTWMLQIARNQGLDQVRSRGFRNSRQTRDLEHLVPDGNSASVSSYNPETIGIKEVVNKLEEEYKELIELLFFKGYTQAEAAEKLNIPLGTVKTRSRAALMKLRQQFEAGEKN